MINNDEMIIALLHAIYLQVRLNGLLQIGTINQEEYMNETNKIFDNLM